MADNNLALGRNAISLRQSSKQTIVCHGTVMSIMAHGFTLLVNSHTARDPLPGGSSRTAEVGPSWSTSITDRSSSKLGDIKQVSGLRYRTVDVVLLSGQHYAAVYAEGHLIYRSQLIKSGDSSSQSFPVQLPNH